MKRTTALLFVAFICIATQRIHAQTDYRNLFKLGIGLTHYKTSDFKFEEPYLAFTYERRIQRVGIGVFLAEGQFDGYTEDMAFNQYWTTKETGTFTVIGLRADYFFFSKKRIELYGGLNCGLAAIDNLYKNQYSLWRDPVYSGTRGMNKASDANGFKVGTQIGAHYWIREHFGFWAEVNIGSAVCNFGIALSH